MNLNSPTEAIPESLVADEDGRTHSPSLPAACRKRHPGRGALLAIVVGISLALALPFVPFVPVSESSVTGAALMGLASGWLLLGLLLGHATKVRQRWALLAALVFAEGGLLLLTFGAPAHRFLDWVWPPALLGIAVWMVWSVRWQRGIPKAVLYPVAVLLVLASVGGGIETVAETADTQSHPVPGRLVDVGGHRLHLRCTGSGSPTVVFEAGGAVSSSGVGRISAAVARDTRICTYDRAGRGWSDDVATPPSGKQIAVDLHTALHRSGERGPYVLGGHSFGGLYVRSFAKLYPKEVAGMVLVDSTAPDRAAHGGEGSTETLHRVAALLSVSARFGLIRLLNAFIPAGLPAPYEEEVQANAATARSLESSLDEYIDAGDSVRDAATLTSIGDKPLVVLTASIGHDSSWFQAQNEMLNLSTDSVHRIVPGVDHPGMVASERGAAATAHSIADVVTAVRTGQRLASAGGRP
ncbi:alpha/beta fold hydrolase [Leifsonia sp. LS-T14]|uniref:alpha/beta fold hydrolase n=1 Tax=unclassified Leifsonia TaxID=2663824 RepID=UPI0035A6A468